MKFSYQRRRAGFTLIELVATLALTGLALVFTAMLLTTSTRVFVSSNYAVEDSQKIQIAMNRLVKELTFAGTGTVVVPDARTVQWTSSHPDRLGESLAASWDGSSGSDLYLQGTPLLNNVDTFSVSSTTGTITLVIGSSRGLGVLHRATVHPRYEL